MKYINFEELKKAIPNGWGKRDFLKRFLQSAPVTAIKCDYFTERKLNEFTNGATVNGFSIVYAYERSASTWYTFETCTKARAEELRKDKTYTKYICFQTVEAVEELQRIRNERQKSRRPFGEKYYKRHNYYHCNKPIQTDKSGYTSYYQMMELKQKAATLRAERAKTAYKKIDSIDIIKEIQTKIKYISSLTFTASAFNCLIIKECTTFIKEARAFIEKESKKEFSTPEIFFKGVDGVRAFYGDIMEDINGEKKYYYRYIWKFDKQTKRPDRTTAHEFKKYNTLYNSNGEKVYNISKNGRVNLLSILKA